MVHAGDNAREAVKGADVVITDTWVSMGDTDHDERIEALEPYQVDEAALKALIAAAYRDMRLRLDAE